MGETGSVRDEYSFFYGYQVTIVAMYVWVISIKIIKGLLPFVATPFILVIYKKVKRVETSQFQVVLIKHTNCCIFKANENYILK